MHLKFSGTRKTFLGKWRQLPRVRRGNTRRFRGTRELHHCIVANIQGIMRFIIFVPFHANRYVSSILIRPEFNLYQTQRTFQCQEREGALFCWELWFILFSSCLSVCRHWQSFKKFFASAPFIEVTLRLEIYAARHLNDVATPFYWHDSHFLRRSASTWWNLCIKMVRLCGPNLRHAPSSGYSNKEGRGCHFEFFWYFETDKQN